MCVHGYLAVGVNIREKRPGRALSMAQTWWRGGGGSTLHATMARTWWTKRSACKATPGSDRIAAGRKASTEARVQTSIIVHSPRPVSSCRWGWGDSPTAGCEAAWWCATVGSAGSCIADTPVAHRIAATWDHERARNARRATERCMRNHACEGQGRTRRRPGRIQHLAGRRRHLGLEMGEALSRDEEHPAFV